MLAALPEWDFRSDLNVAMGRDLMDGFWMGIPSIRDNVGESTVGFVGEGNEIGEEAEGTVIQIDWSPCFLTYCNN